MNNSVEFDYIEGLITKHTFVQVRISSGFCIEGRIISQDDIAIVIQEEKEGRTRNRMQYKHDISNIVPFNW